MSLASKAINCPRWVVLPLVLWVTGAARTAAAEPPQVVGLQVGFAGRYKLGQWTPLSVTLRGGDQTVSGRLEIVVPDADGVPTRVSTNPARPVELPSGREVVVPMFVKLGQPDAVIKVSLRSEGQALAERVLRSGDGEFPAPLAAAQELLVVLGGDGSLEPAQPVNSDDPAARQVSVRLVDAGDLPTQWYGYEGVDALVVAGGSPEIFRGLAEDGVRLAALDRWLEMGGTLLLSVGADARELLIPGAVLARFAPGRFEQLVTLRQSGVFETYAETSDQLESTSAVAEEPFRLVVPKLIDVRGRIEAFEGSVPRDLPLVVRRPYGFGQIVFAAFDVSRRPFAQWRARPQLIDKLLAQPRRAAELIDNSDTLGEVTTLGYTDISGQLHAALEQFAGVQLVPFSVVAVLVVIYLLCIGPLDYFLLRRVLGRMELTWVTFPLIVLLFSGAAYGLAVWLKGDQLRLNQIDLVDVDVPTGLARGTTWSDVYSPEVDRFDLSLQPLGPTGTPPADAQVLLSWMGAPGTGLSGMRAGAGGSLFLAPYDYSTHLDRLLGVPIATWSTKAFTGRWSGQVPMSIDTQLLDTGDRLLSGRLTNRLDIPLTHCVLLYDRWAYPIRELAAGAELQIETAIDPQTVETYLRHITVLDEKDYKAPYDQAGLDSTRTMEVMMFYDVAGGEGYTGLTHRAQRFTDLSIQLRIGQALLVGRAARPGARLLRDEQPLAADGVHETWYRFVLPVEQAK